MNKCLFTVNHSIADNDNSWLHNTYNQMETDSPIRVALTEVTKYNSLKNDNAEELHFNVFPLRTNDFTQSYNI